MSYLPPLDSYKEAKEILSKIAEICSFPDELKLDSQHFHHPKKGCLLIKTYGKGDLKHRVIYQTCKTHNVKVCRCGWEFGWHFGLESAKLPDITTERMSHRPKIDYGKGKCYRNNCLNYAKNKGLCVKHYTQELRNQARALKHTHYLPQD